MTPTEGTFMLVDKVSGIGLLCKEGADEGTPAFGKNEIVLNPHYKKFGLHGSELHTYSAAYKLGNSFLY